MNSDLHLTALALFALFALVLGGISLVLHDWRHMMRVSFADALEAIVSCFLWFLIIALGGFALLCASLILAS